MHNNVFQFTIIQEMSKWKKNETKFEVALNYILGSYICRMPRPIVEMFGIPDGIRFVSKGKNMVVMVGQVK
ncbi:MAG: hypothetical protein OXC46_00730 [Thaumarchaeota archaeon]|nr:hypothetical protein [Nitrososphaerota archaeon]